MKLYAFGVDIGGTTVKLGLFDTDGLLLEKWEIPTRTQQNGAQILPDIARTITEKLNERGIRPEQVKGIGVGVPGPVGADDTVYRCVNLGWGELNVREEMNQLLPSIPHVAAGNDANVAALGELWKGGAQGYKSVVMLTLGTGVGCGVLLDGKIVAGTHGGAGEVGHMTVNFEETEPCNCGRYGCLEQYASANGIVHLAKQMLAQSELPCPLRDMDSFTSKEICDLARAGDEMAKQVVTRCADYLGRAMSYISCTVDPEIYVIGGGMSRAGAVLIDAILERYRHYAFHVSSGTGVAVATLGNDAGIYGCARMIL